VAALPLIPGGNQVSVRGAFIAGTRGQLLLNFPG
jgi:hypothetical protein